MNSIVYKFKSIPDLNFPFYSNEITLKELKKRAKEIKNLNLIKNNYEKYKVFGVHTKTQLIFYTYNGNYTRFISDWEETKYYDQLAQYFTEKELIKCAFGNYRPLKRNFVEWGSYLYQQMEKKKYKNR